MNLTLYKRRRLRQKPHILTIEQSRELSQLAGTKLLKHVSNPGLIPTNLFRLRKRKLESIYKYLFDHHLIHDKEPVIESLQTHQLAEYLLSTIYPGYPACKAKNQAYTDYRQCREKDIGQIPLAYDYVPTTEVYERLDELYRVDVNFQQQKPCIQIPISSLRKSMDRIRAAHFEKSFENIEFHLYFWNSTRTLLKPQCILLKLDSQDLWSDKTESMVAEGFMHVDITEKLKPYLAKRTHTPAATKAANEEKTPTVKPSSKGKAVPIAVPSNSKKSVSPPPPHYKSNATIQLQVELENNDEYNISHISITAVTRKSTNELVSDLYLQTTTESISKSLHMSLCPLDTQQIAIHLLRQFHESKENMLLTSAENIFMTCLSNSEAISSSEEEEEVEEEEAFISLIDPVSLSRIQHPVKSLHCKHRSCFDAAIFFDHNADIKLWHCPICFVHIKNIEELRMDYRNKVALAQYPDEEKLFVLQKDTLLSESEMFGEEEQGEHTNDAATASMTDNEENGIKRSFILCDDTDDNVDTTDHSQKRYRTMVM